MSRPNTWIRSRRPARKSTQKVLTIDLLESRSLLTAAFTLTHTAVAAVRDGTQTIAASFLLTSLSSTSTLPNDGSGNPVVGQSDSAYAFNGTITGAPNSGTGTALPYLGLGMYTTSDRTLIPSAQITEGSLVRSAGGTVNFSIPAANLYSALPSYGSNTINLDILHTSTAYVDRDLRLTYTLTVFKVGTPTLAALATQTVNENSSVGIRLDAGTFTTSDSFNKYTITSGPSHGSLSAVPGSAGGTITYTPTAHQHASDSFTYTVTDKFGFVSAPQTVNITVNTTAAVLVAQATQGTQLNTALVVPTTTSTPGNIFYNATNTDGNALTLSVVTSPSHGTLVLNGNTGGYTYTPTTGYSGSDSFGVRANDAIDGLNSNTVTENLYVVPTPTINTTFQTSVGVNGSSPTNSTQAILSGTSEANSKVNVYDNGSLIGNVPITNNSSGNWTYTATGLSGSGNPSTHAFTVQTVDGSSFSSLTSNTLTVRVDTVAPAAPVISSITPNSGTSTLTNSSGTLTLNGTAESGSTVKIYQGSSTTGTLVGTITATGGSWSLALGTFSGGNYSYTATATDTAGNTGSSSTFSFTVDRTAPAAPVFTNVTPNSGTSNITRFNPLTLNGTAEAGSTVTLYNGATRVGSATATGGSWSISLGTLADAVYSYTATATDAAGNLSAASAYSITVDTTVPAKPVISGISPGTTSTLTRFHSFTLSGTAEANSIVSVVIAGVGTAVGTATANGTGNWSLSLSNIADGNYSYTATASDAAGNVSAASTTFSYTVDSTAPAAPVISGVTPNSGSPNITNRNVLMLSGTAEANSEISVVVAGTNTVVGTATTSGSGSWSISLGSAGSPLADGTYSYTATATDIAGNTSVASSTFNLTVLTTAPAVPAITTISPNTGVPGYTNANVLTLSGTGVNGTTITVKNAATSAVVGTSSVSGGVWSIPLGSIASPLPDGTTSYVATATDIATNVSPASAAYSVTVDTVKPAAPVISSVSPDTGTAGSHLSQVSSVTFSGTAEANSTVKVISNKGGTTPLGTTTTNGSGAWSFTTGALADGVYPITATATDRAGNISNVSATFTVTIDTQPIGTPIIMSVTPDTGIVGDGVTSATVLTIHGTGMAGNTITLHQVESNTDYATTPTIDSSGNWQLTLPTMTSGTYHFTATSTDSRGAKSAASTVFAVTIDTHTPAAPAITAITPDNGVSNDAVTNVGAFVLSGTAEANATVTITDADANSVLGTTTVNGSGAWLFTIGASTPLNSGTYHYAATAADLAGTTSAASASFKVVIDLHTPGAPVIVGITPDTGASNSDGVTTAKTFTLSGTAEAGGTVTIFNASTNTILGTATANGAGTWTFTIGSGTPLSDGTYRYTATTTDLAGTTGPSASPFTVVVDTHVPAAPFIASITPDTGSSSTDEVTNASSITLQGTAEANSVVTITDADRSQVLGTTTANGSGAWSYAIVSTLTDGVHHYTATATDLAGSTSAASAPFAVTIDTHTPAAPDLTGISPDTGVSSTDDITNATVLTLLGTAEANAVVTIRNTDSNTVLGTATADASGHWSFALGGGSPLGNGVYHYAATATDLAGTTSSSSSVLRVTVDTHLPSSPIINGITPDSGVSGDGVTNVPTFSVFGVAEANSTVTVTNSDTSQVIGSATADALGNWSLLLGSPQPLNDGTYHFAATATDVAGTTGAPGTPYTVVLVTNRPATPTLFLDPASDSGASNSDNVTNINTPTFDIQGIVPNATVQLLRNGTIVATMVSTTGGTVSLGESTPVSDGDYQYTARQIDLAGNISNVSTVQSVTIDTVAPTITVVGPIAPPIRNTSLASVNITFSQAIDLTSFTPSAVELYRDGNLVPAAGLSLTLVSGSTYQLNGLGTYTSSGGAPLDGVYTLTIDATKLADIAGNSGSGEAGANFTIDTVPPQIVSVGPVTPSLRNTSVDIVNVVFSKPINPVTFTTAALGFMVDNATQAIGNGVTITQIDDTTYQIGGLNALTNPGVQPSTHTYVLNVNGATISDLAGNSSSGSDSTSFTIDTTLPALVSIAQVTPHTRNAAVSSVDVTFSKAIDVSTFNASSFSLTFNGASLPLGDGLSVSLVSGTTYRISGLDTLTSQGGNPISGSYVLTVSAGQIRDNVGNPGSGTASTSFVIDTTQPTVTSIAPNPIPSPRSSPVSSVVFNVSKPVDNSTVSIADVALTRNLKGVALTGVSVVQLSPTSFQVNGLGSLTALEGNYTLTIKALFRDQVGNVGTGTLASNWIVDHTAPTINGIVNLTVQATSESGAVVNYPNIFASDTVDLLSDPVQLSIPSGTLLPVGTTTVIATSTDRSGNTAQNSFTVTVLPFDNTPPTAAPLNFLSTKKGLTNLVIQFSEAMNLAQVYNLGAYQLSQVTGSGKKLKYTPVGLTLANYDPTKNTVTLTFKKVIATKQKLQLTLIASQLSDAHGNLLAGAGGAGTNFVRVVNPGLKAVRTDLKPAPKKK